MLYKNGHSYATENLVFIFLKGRPKGVPTKWKNLHGSLRIDLHGGWLNDLPV